MRAGIASCRVLLKASPAPLVCKARVLLLVEQSACCPLCSAAPCRVCCVGLQAFGTASCSQSGVLPQPMMAAAGAACYRGCCVKQSACRAVAGQDLAAWLARLLDQHGDMLCRTCLGFGGRGRTAELRFHGRLAFVASSCTRCRSIKKPLCTQLLTEAGIESAPCHIWMAAAAFQGEVRTCWALTKQRVLTVVLMQVYATSAMLAQMAGVGATQLLAEPALKAALAEVYGPPGGQIPKPAPAGEFH